MNYDQTELDSEQRRIEYNTGFDAAASIYNKKCVVSYRRGLYYIAYGICNKCKKEFIADNLTYKFCPYCGAEIINYEKQQK